MMECPRLAADSDAQRNVRETVTCSGRQLDAQSEQLIVVRHVIITRPENYVTVHACLRQQSTRLIRLHFCRRRS